MQDVDPKVSTASRFFTNTYFSDNLFAVIANDIVMHPSNPSGTFATKIPIPKTILSTGPIFMTAAPKMTKTTPKTIAIIVIINTNLSSSILRGDFGGT